MRVDGLRIFLGLLLVTVVSTPFVKAQGIAQSLSPGGEAQPDGFRIYTISLYGVYSSTTLPFGSGLAALSTPQAFGSGGTTAPNYLAGIIGSIGWRKTGARTTAFVNYTPSYDASVRYFTANSMNNSLTFGVDRELAPKWTLTVGGVAMTARWNQFLLAPTLFGSIVGTPTTIDDLISGLLAGKYTNGQLASILTGAPQIESPGASLLYGTRLFDSALHTGISYAKSPRLTLRGDITGTRVQHLNSGDTPGNKIFLVPVTTTASASLGATYAFSPFTFLDFDATSSRVFSRFTDEYVSNATVSVAKVLGRRLIVQVRGGAGIITPVRQTFRIKPGPHYLAGTTLTYKTLSHTFMGSFDHTITDTYGLGATSASVGSGAWSWHLPGRRWSVSTMGRYEFLENLSGHSLNAWLANAGLMRLLESHTMVRVGYFYGRTSGVLQGILSNRPIQGAELVFSFSPQQPFGM